MGRKSNLRKKFGKLKLRDQANEDDQRPDVEGSRSMENNAASREELADDRLTSLPRNIISNILSRLETSQAVRTCVLSKSWVNKWTSITDLNCFDGFPLPKPHFLDGIESVIPKVSCLKLLSLNCFHMHDPSRLKSLVLSALRSYPLETLAVSMVSAPLSLCLCLFKKSSLTKLDLNGNLSLTFPADASFSHLKSIRLCDVTLQNFHLSSSGKVVLKMPVLEDFKLIKCSFWNVDSLEIVAPLLSKMEVVQCSYFDVNDRLLSHCIVGISGGNNIDFTYIGSFSEEFFIRNPSNVAISNLTLFLTEFHDCLQVLIEAASSARLLLEKLHSSLKMLELSQEVILALADFGPSNALPVFENLKHAKLPMLCCFTCPDTMNNVAVEVLTSAPFLVELTITRFARCKMCKNGKIRDFKQKCGIIGGTFQRLLAGDFMVGLKRVKFEAFNSWVEEVELARLFLEHASVLRELSIPFTSKAVAKKLERKFSAFPKASENASVVFLF